jgi:hypothetical protein
LVWVNKWRCGKRKRGSAVAVWPRGSFFLPVSWSQVLAAALHGAQILRADQGGLRTRRSRMAWRDWTFRDAGVQGPRHRAQARLTLQRVLRCAVSSLSPPLPVLRLPRLPAC